MKTVQGVCGHFFDYDTYSFCPDCGAEVDPKSLEDKKTGSGVQKTPTGSIWKPKDSTDIGSDTGNGGQVSQPTNDGGIAGLDVQPKHDTEDVKKSENDTGKAIKSETAYTDRNHKPKNNSLIAILGIIAGLLLLLLLFLIITNLVKNKAIVDDKPMTAQQGIESETGKATNEAMENEEADETGASALSGMVYHDGESFIIDWEKEGRVIVGGFISGNCKTVAITIPLPKAAVGLEPEIKAINLNIRHADGGYLLTDSYIEGGYDILADTNLVISYTLVADSYLTIIISNEDGYGVTNNIPVSADIFKLELLFKKVGK